MGDVLFNDAAIGCDVVRAFVTRADQQRSAGLTAALSLAAGEEWVKMDDSRYTCLQCLHTLVRNTPDAQPLFDDVLRFYASMSMVRPCTVFCIAWEAVWC